MPLAREGRPGGFRGWVGCGGGSNSPSRAGPRGWGERSRGGSGRPAVSGGCRTQFQLGKKKKKKLNCPAPSNRCVSRRKLGSRSRSFSPLSCPPRVPAWVPAVGPGKVKARRVQPAGEALVARGEEPGFPHSASPPPLGAHRRLLLRPGGAPLRRRRSWRLGPGGASAARFRWGQPRSAGGRDRVLPALAAGTPGQSRLREAPVGCGAARGCEIHPHSGRFQAAEGRLEEGGARALQAGDPTGGDRSTPALRPLRARGFLVAARFLLGFPRLCKPGRIRLAVAGGRRG